MLRRGLVHETRDRMRFYTELSDLLCMVARPPENRRGHCKKASNMNYCLMVAQGVTQLMREHGMTPGQARSAFSKTFPPTGAFIAGGRWEGMKGVSACQTTHPPSPKLQQFSFLGGDLTLEDDALILLLDSSSRMHDDVITRIAPEFVAAPSLGYAQCLPTAFGEQRRNCFQVHGPW